MGRVLENNHVTVIGTIVEEFIFNHEIYGERFYTSMVSSARLSETVDYIPITVSERLVDVSAAWCGQNVEILGTFRSYNRHTETGTHLILSVFVDEIQCVEDDIRAANSIHLEGYICKEPNYRKTPFGREITDILIAVNRLYQKSDYIPCITWGRSARFTSELKVGTRVSLDGRIQSREYQKMENDDLETRIAYEVSATNIELSESMEENGETL